MRILNPVYHLILYHFVLQRKEPNLCTTFYVKDKLYHLDDVNGKKHFVINDYQWKKIYGMPFQCTKSSKLLWLQYRINQFILTTNTTLYKYGKKDTKLCSFCNLEDETIKHSMWDCTKSQELISIFKNHCLDNSAHYATNSFTFI